MGPLEFALGVIAIGAGTFCFFIHIVKESKRPKPVEPSYE